MCNLYSVHTTQAMIRRAFNIARDNAGNMPPLPGVFPDQMAPVVRVHDGERELLQMRWGFPPPPNVGNQPGHQCAQRRLPVLAGHGSSRNTAASCR